MPYYLLDGRLCPMLPLDQLTADGKPRRAVYFYKSTEGIGGVETRSSASLVEAPDDDGASWTGKNVPTGANLYVLVSDSLNLQVVLDRLLRAHANKERAAKERLGGATHGEPSEERTLTQAPDPVKPAAAPAPASGDALFDPKDKNRDGVVSEKEARKFEKKG